MCDLYYGLLDFCSKAIPTHWLYSNSQHIGSPCMYGLFIFRPSRILRYTEAPQLPSLVLSSAHFYIQGTGHSCQCNWFCLSSYLENICGADFLKWLPSRNQSKRQQGQELMFPMCFNGAFIRGNYVWLPHRSTQITATCSLLRKLMSNYDFPDNISMETCWEHQPTFSMAFSVYVLLSFYNNFLFLQLLATSRNSHYTKLPIA